LELNIGRKDNELHELRQTLEEKTEQIVSLQDEGVKRAKELKVVKEKRDMGLKEIQKLRDKMEQIKVQNSLNESLNTSFSLSALNDSVNLSNMEKGQISDLLQMYYN
jgi:ribosomal protein L7/L12